MARLQQTMAKRSRIKGKNCFNLLVFSFFMSQRVVLQVLLMPTKIKKKTENARLMKKKPKKSASSNQRFVTLCVSETKVFLFLQREKGSLAQLVQSIALTRRGSLVRVQQFPLKNRDCLSNPDFLV